MLVRGGATLFFVGCGLTHVHIAVHAITGNPAAHELFFHTIQLVGGWVFVYSAIRHLNIRVEPRERQQQLREIEKLQRLTLRDPLTGAWNRRYHDEALAREMDRFRRHGSPLSVAHVDLDDFKELNDAGGHALGDEVLRAFATTALGVLRPSDHVIRLGGDEFMLVFPQTARGEALSIIERLRAELAGAQMVGPFGIAISAGVASCPEDTTDADELAEIADRALYWAKDHGKNRCASAEELELAAQLPSQTPNRPAVPNREERSPRRFERDIAALLTHGSSERRPRRFGHRFLSH
jgi:diguanylate cyclase (GGDEF)-like protein